MNGEEISDGLSTERKVEIRVRKNGRKDKVIVEKSAAEGLPEGWIKKLELTNRAGRKFRRDSFFIDPKSEYVFQSFKDATRYVETGDIGQYARKLKESDKEDNDSGNGENILCLDSVEKRSADDLLEKEKKINSHVRNSKRTRLSSSDELTENCKMNSDLSSITSQVLEDLVKEETKDPTEKQPIAKRVTRSQAKTCKNEEAADLKRKIPSSSNAKSEDCVESRLSSARSQDPGKESVMKEEEVQNSTEKWTTTSKDTLQKKKLSNSVGVARRASKRLAGIELEPTPELKTRPKVQRIETPDDEPMPELKTRPKAQRIVIPDDEPMAELTRRTKALLKVPPGNELMPERKTRTRAQRIVPLDNGTAGKCKQPVISVATSGLKKMDKPFKIEVAKSCNEHHLLKPDAAAATNNNVDAEMAVGNEKSGKTVGRNSSRDKKKIKTPEMIYELNPFFHLDGYEQKEKVSPASPLSRQTSATKHEKTPAGKRLGQSSPKTKLATDVKVTEIPPLSGNATVTTQSRNKLGNELAQPSVVRGSCSEVMEKKTNSFTLDSTLADLWKDPCIAFAIKTLTGDSISLPNTAAISSDPMNNHIEQKGVSFFPETQETVNSCAEKPRFPSAAPPGTDIWTDPCINFAIKTLTGAIPVGVDELDAKSKSEGMTMTSTTAATQESEGRRKN